MVHFYGINVALLEHYDLAVLIFQQIRILKTLQFFFVGSGPGADPMRIFLAPMYAMLIFMHSDWLFKLFAHQSSKKQALHNFS